MATNNAKGLQDYFANASGGGIRYETGKFHGFSFAVSGFFVFNTGSSNLEIKDSITGASNRYEIGLFDIEDPNNKKDIDRLEEFYIKYNRKTFDITLGRQLINTPFVNLQDGRMRPTGVEGLWTNYNISKKLSFEGGWLYAISPRSTTKWYRIDESIGTYASGVSSTGVKSDYKGNIKSNGLFLGGFQYNPFKKTQITAYNLFTDNVFNASLLQISSQYSLSQKTQLILAAQGIQETSIANGGNAIASKRYFDKGVKSYTYGFRVGLQSKNIEFTMNYNRITKHGRYLMPREFGRDPFFTFMPRERNEGLGDVHAYMAKLLYKIPQYRLQSSVSVGYFKLPDVLNFRLNKYGMPTYSQINLDLRYMFSGVLKGLELQFLYVNKFKLGNIHGRDIYKINKVDMQLYNLVLNFHF